jgi:hypothetical protein
MQKTSGDSLKFWLLKISKALDFSTFKFKFLFWLSIASPKKRLGYDIAKVAIIHRKI